MAGALDEKTYRNLVDEVLRRVDAAFEKVDPDLAEVQLGQGTLAIIFRGKVKCILSPQPPVQQLWLACRDRAWHFDWDPNAGCWKDDRGGGLEVFALLAQLCRDEAGVQIEFK